jgi:hypothetical protein
MGRRLPPMVLKGNEIREFDIEFPGASLFEKHPYLERLDSEMISRCYNLQTAKTFDHKKTLEIQFDDVMDSIEICFVFEKELNIDIMQDSILSYIISNTVEYVRKHNRYYNLKIILNKD